MSIHLEDGRSVMTAEIQRALEAQMIGWKEEYARMR